MTTHRWAVASVLAVVGVVAFYYLVRVVLPTLDLLADRSRERIERKKEHEDGA